MSFPFAVVFDMVVRICVLWMYFKRELWMMFVKRWWNIWMFIPFTGLSSVRGSWLCACFICDR